MNQIKTWQQGSFVDSPIYRHWTKEEKERAKTHESFLVRPYPKGNAICQCNTPDDAKWIAQRLNLASELEQLTYDFATGKNDGQLIIDFVMGKLKD